MKPILEAIDQVVLEIKGYNNPIMRWDDTEYVDYKTPIEPSPEREVEEWETSDLSGQSEVLAKSKKMSGEMISFDGDVSRKRTMQEPEIVDKMEDMHRSGKILIANMRQRMEGGCSCQPKR